MRANYFSVWAVHLLTASGAMLALFALIAAANAAWQAVFLLLGLALIVDGVDGPLARRLRTAERVPWFDGAALDQIVDFTTYVLVPAVVIVLSELVPAGFRFVSGALVAVVGALYFADTRMKTTDAAFRGFPAVWNAVVFMLFVVGLPSAANLAVIVLFAVLTFVPIEFVHPLRGRRLRVVTLAVAGIWSVAAIVAVVSNFSPGSLGVGVLAGSSLYFAVVGGVMQFGRRRRG